MSDELFSNRPNQEQQDLGIQKPAIPDQNWARTQPMFIAPSKQRLDREHQLVSVKNTSDLTVTVQGKPVPQVHIVIDRYNQGHELQPGETKHNIDMLADDIEYFIRERMPNRINHMGRTKPLHPLQIIGYNETHLRGEQQQPQSSNKQSVPRERTTKEA